MTLFLLYAALAVFTHTLLHELAHAAVAYAYGASNVRVYPYPRLMDGRFTFASVTYGGVFSLAASARIYAAPVYVSVTWWLLGAVVSLTVPALRPYALIDCAFALVDLTTWTLGLLRGHIGTDGDSWRRARGLSLPQAWFLSAVLVIPYAVTVLSLFLVHFGRG